MECNNNKSEFPNFPFLALPGELRNMIYQHCVYPDSLFPGTVVKNRRTVRDKSIVHLPPENNRATEKVDRDGSRLFTNALVSINNKQIISELIMGAHKNALFVFKSPESLTRFVGTMSLYLKLCNPTYIEEEEGESRPERHIEIDFAASMGHRPENAS